MLCSLHAAGARHVLHDDVGLPGQVLAYVPSQGATIDIETAARVGADYDSESLALIGALGKSLIVDEHTNYHGC
jgi:hypothetical protein